MRVVLPALLAAALGFAAPARASETWLTVLGASHHWRAAGHHYNQRNYGVALDYKFKDGDALIVGGYKNSFARTSSMAFYGVHLARKRPFGLDFDARLLLGGVSGYGDSEAQRQHFGPQVLPQVTLRGKRVGVMVIGMPGLLMGAAIEIRLP